MVSLLVDRSAGIRMSDSRLDDPIVWFCETVAKRFTDMRIAKVPSPDGAIARFLVAPADRFKDEILPAQKARQEQAGAMPPEVYGHDLFELLKGNVVRLRDGSRIAFYDANGLRAFLSKFLDPGSFHGQQLTLFVERIREGQNAFRKGSSTSRLVR